MFKRPDLLGFHGFQYQPGSRRHDPKITFALWERVCDRPLTGWGWYSVPPGVNHVIRAWLNGRWNRYRYAWDLAGAEALKVVDGWADHGADIKYAVGHSLGSYLLLLACCGGLGLRRVLLWNGAAKLSTALSAAEAAPETQFFNVVVEADDVLRLLGERFAPGDREPCIGYAGLGVDAPPNWHDLHIDHIETKIWGLKHGWNLAGDNPAKIGDHRYTYQNPDNRHLWARIFDETISPGELPKPRWRADLPPAQT